MRYISAAELDARLEFPPLIDALRELFRRGVDDARAIHLNQPLADGRRNDWLLLPAWQFDRHMGIKLVSVFAGNESQGLASIQGLYVLFDGRNGQPVAAIDGAGITLWKTAAKTLSPQGSAPRAPALRPSMRRSPPAPARTRPRRAPRAERRRSPSARGGVSATRCCRAKCLRRASMGGAPEGYETFKHKQDECVKVVLKP